MIHSIIYILGILLIFTSFLTIFYSIYILWWRRKFRHIPIPAATGNFFFPHIEIISKEIQRHVTILDICKQLNSSLFQMHVLHHVFVMYGHPKDLERVLLKSRFLKPKIYKNINVYGKNVVSDGIFAQIVHSKWKAHRTILNNAFSKTMLENYVNVFNENADKIVQEMQFRLLEDQTCSDWFDLKKVFCIATTNAIAKAGFDWDILNDLSIPRDFFERIFALLAALDESYRGNALKKYFPTMWKKISTLNNYADELRDTLWKKICLRMQSIENFQENDIQGNILDCIIQCYKEDSNKERAIDEFLTILIAGEDTTANFLSFLFLELEKNPSIKEKLLEEIQEVLCERYDGHITLQMLNKLKYMKAVFKEVLRLYPPAHGTIREIPENFKGIQLSGSTSMIKDDKYTKSYFIPRGAILWADFYITNYLFYPQHENFDPEIFYENEYNQENSLKFGLRPYPLISFSFGPRNCVGKDFFWTQAPIIVSKLLNNLKFEIKYEHENKIKIETKFTDRVYGELLCRVKKHSN